MSARRLLDTNLIVRHLTQDHPAHAAIAGKLFDASDRGELTLVILPTVLAECVFVLESFYNHTRGSIGSALESLLSRPGIEIDHAEMHRDALRRYAGSKLHYVDCTIAAVAVASQTPIATFDAGLRKQTDVTVRLD